MMNAMSTTTAPTSPPASGRVLEVIDVVTQDGEDGVCCPPLTRAPLDAEDAERLADLLKALADPKRLRLLSLIAAHENGEACVCDLTDQVDLRQPTVSHHLKILISHGLLTREKRGIFVFYRTVPEQMRILGQLFTPR
jgi:ArsR family transcriptional regulator